MVKVKPEEDLTIPKPVATLGYMKKPLGAWPDNAKHEATRSPEEEDEESAVGSMPASGSDETGDVDEITNSMGIYDETEPRTDKPNSGPENPAEVNIAGEIEKNDEG